MTIGPVHPPAAIRVGVVIPAAGSGRRMGGVKKPFLELAGVPVLKRALGPFLADTRVVSIVIALAPDDAAAPPSWLDRLDPRIRIVAGGDTRTVSVRQGLAGLPEDLDVIAVHDAARPFVEPEVVGRCIDLAARGVGAIAGVQAVDTIKRVGTGRVIVETPDRASLWQAQTPQVFPAEGLRAAYAAPGAGGTDDAALVEATGLRVEMVDAGSRNIKITHPADLPVGEALLRSFQPNPEP